MTGTQAARHVLFLPILGVLLHRNSFLFTHFFSLISFLISYFQQLRASQVGDVLLDFDGLATPLACNRGAGKLGVHLLG
jgi:hypothetical protein